MNRMMNTVVMMMVAGMLASGATAFGADAPTNQLHAARNKGAKSVVASKELSLTGIVAQQEIKVAGKERTVFVLITSTGARLHLPTAKAGKQAAPAIRLADYVGQNVKVLAMGSEKTKGDKTVVKIKAVKAIEKLPGTPGDTTPGKMA